MTSSRPFDLLQTLRPPPELPAASRASQCCLRSLRPPPEPLTSSTTSRPPYLHAVQTSKPRLRTSIHQDLQTSRPLRLYAYTTSRPTRLPDLHDLQTSRPPPQAQSSGKGGEAQTQRWQADSRHK